VTEQECCLGISAIAANSSFTLLTVLRRTAGETSERTSFWRASICNLALRIQLATNAGWFCLPLCFAYECFESELKESIICLFLVFLSLILSSAWLQLFLSVTPIGRPIVTSYLNPRGWNQSEIKICKLRQKADEKSMLFS